MNFNPKLSAQIKTELERYRNGENVVDVIEAVLVRWPQLTLQEFLGGVVLYKAALDTGEYETTMPAVIGHA